MPESVKYFVTHNHTYVNTPQLRLFVVHNPLIPENRYCVLALCDAEGGRDFVLHWGVGIDSPQEWAGPPAAVVPPFQPSTTITKDFAVTPFVAVNQLEHEGELHHWIDDFLDAENLTPTQWRLVIIRLTTNPPCPIVGINFVLNSNNEWIKNGNGNFNIDLGGLANAETELLSLGQFLQKHAPQDANVTLKWRVRSGKRTFLLQAMITALSERLDLVVVATHPNKLVLHWGGCAGPDQPWRRLPTQALLEENVPQKSIVIDDKALQTSFTFPEAQVSIQLCRISIQAGAVPLLISFVLKEAASNIWLKNGDVDFVLHLPQRAEWKARQLEVEEQLRKEKELALARIEQDAKRWTRRLERFAENATVREQEATIAYETIQMSDDIGIMDCVVLSEDAADGKHFIVLKIYAVLREDCVLHWGCVGVGGEIQRRKTGEWTCPPPHLCPPNTTPVDKKAAQTPLVPTPERKFEYTMEIRFPATQVPVTSSSDIGLRAEFGGVCFVLKEANGGRWFKASDHRDILIRLHPVTGVQWTGSHRQLVTKIVEAEVEWDHMTLMHRYHLCNSILDDHLNAPPSNVTEAAIAEEHDFWAWIYVWNRFSFLCWLDWQRRYNTKPKDLAHAAEVLSCKVARCWATHPRHRAWIRMTLATMGRGGSAGQAIRDRILDIMHKHKIPETAGNFYEQWHQKLHNNTTPDDIGICLAVIKYLETQSLDEFWKVLRAHDISAEKLASYERKITQQPYMPHCDIGGLIWDLRQYLDILKEVHDALDLGKSAGRVRHMLSGEIQGRLDHVCHEAHQGQVHSFQEATNRIGRIYDVRKAIITRLNGDERNDSVIRDLLLLDFSLESLQSTLLQGAKKTEGTKENWMLVLGWFVELWALHNPAVEEWARLAGDWSALGLPAIRGKYSHDGRINALLVKALIDRLTRCVGDTTDLFQERLGPMANFLGQQVDVDSSKLNVFVDEVLRGSALFAISLGVKHLEPHIRADAELPPWQLISLVAKTRGVLQSVATLSNIQDKVFETPTILISDAVNGEEEIPTGVQAVLVRSAAAAPDILSHIAVRARNAHVLLAVCFDGNIIAKWEKEFQNKWVEITMTLGGADLAIEQFEQPKSQPDVLQRRGSLTKRTSRKLSQPFDRQLTQSKLAEIDMTSKLSRAASIKDNQVVDLRTPSEHFFITVDKFTRELVGSKSANLQVLKSKLPHMKTPRAFALPYGSLQKTLCAEENQHLLVQLERILGELGPSMCNQEAAACFMEAQSLLKELRMPLEMRQALKDLWSEIERSNATQNSGVVKASLRELFESTGEERCWIAIKDVWRSIYAMRPWVSLAKANRSFISLNMAVLVQDLMPADYAFVLHSRNPFVEHDDSKPREMYGEIVVGLGEVLVANYPGRALSWKMSERDAGPQIVAFPAKSQALLPEASLIFRSDSNGEDLEGFAGAGLFESVPGIAPKLTYVGYNKVRMVTDQAWRDKMLGRIGKAAFAVEDAFESPMDIEGVVCGEDIIIVQARPQV